MMYRKFLTVVVATAIAITGLPAAPARAGDNDLLKILGGVAAIAIIGSAIAKNRDRDDEVSRRYDYYNHQQKQKHHRHDHHKRKHEYDRNRGHSYHDQHARPLPQRVQRKVLPASCRVLARNRHGSFSAYSDWCLQRNFQYVRALPGRCATKAYLNGNRTASIVYHQRCLSNLGYSSARY